MKNWGFAKVCVFVLVLMLAVQPSLASVSSERAGAQTRVATFSFDQFMAHIEALLNNTIRMFGHDLESNTGEEQDPIG